MITLYHGTSSRYLAEILVQGLLPCCESGRKSNWKGDVQSKPDLVYLTSCYPVFFALSATEEDYEMVVIRVEVPLDDLFPDEDFIACVLHAHEGKLSAMPLTKVNTFVNPRDYEEHAELSLRHNGIVSIDRVTRQQITGYKIVRNMRTIMFIGGDSMPIPINYKILGAHYKRCIEALFRGGEEEALKVAREWKISECAYTD